MREIKFRAWDEIYKRITTKIGHLDLFKALTNKSDRYTMMQYTGLKDKNGVEIYEGDIVTFTNGKELRRGSIDYIESYFRIFNPYICSINLVNETSKGLNEINTVEVIGNIYENKELLR